MQSWILSYGILSMDFLHLSSYPSYKKPIYSSLYGFSTTKRPENRLLTNDLIWQKLSICRLWSRFFKIANFEQFQNFWPNVWTNGRTDSAWADWQPHYFLVVDIWKIVTSFGQIGKQPHHHHQPRHSCKQNNDNLQCAVHSMSFSYFSSLAVVNFFAQKQDGKSSFQCHACSSHLVQFLVYRSHDDDLSHAQSYRLVRDETSRFPSGLTEI